MNSLPLPAAVGQAIAARRTASRLTQAELAESLSMGLRYVSEVERGKHDIRLATLERLSDALGVRASFLLAEAEQRMQRGDRTS